MCAWQRVLQSPTIWRALRHLVAQLGEEAHLCISYSDVLFCFFLRSWIHLFSRSWGYSFCVSACIHKLLCCSLACTSIQILLAQPWVPIQGRDFFLSSQIAVFAPFWVENASVFRPQVPTSSHLICSFSSSTTSLLDSSCVRFSLHCHCGLFFSP